MWTAAKTIQLQILKKALEQLTPADNLRKFRANLC